MTLTLLRSLARRVRSGEAGVGLVEVVVAAAVFLLVAGTALSTLTHAEVATKSSQIQETAVSLAQREVERMRQSGYSKLGLASVPAAAAAGPDVNPTNPNEYVSAGKLLVRSDFHNRNSGLAPHVPAGGEPFVTVATGGVNTGPELMAAGDARFNVYRYVTRVDMQCMVSGSDKCPGTEDAKRITVAVSPVPSGPAQRGPVKPVWVTSVLANPEAIAPGATPPPPVSGASNQTAQPFSLYDTPCNQSSRQAITGSHPVRDTVTAANCAAGAGNKLDLMGVSSPPSGTPTLYDYATDAPQPRIDAAGLALQRPLGGADCAGSYATAVTSKHTMHRWASTPMPPSGFTGGTRSAISVVTKTAGGVQGEATLCLALYKLTSLGVLSSPISPIVSHQIQNPSWPTQATEISFAFNHSSFTLAGNERLVVALWLAGTSLPEGIELQYDHPQADSVLSVSTTTPLS